MIPQYYWGSSDIDAAIEATFKAGKAILAESDTVWGLFIPVTATGASVLDQLKGRHDKPYLVIMDSVDTVNTVAIFPENGSHLLAQKNWPGPLTLLLPMQKGQLSNAQSKSGVAGIRVPNHDPLRHIAELYGGLFSTSANIAGEPTPLLYDQIDPTIRKAVDVVIYNNPAYKPSLQPSTIVDCTGPTMKIIRQGASSCII